MSHYSEPGINPVYNQGVLRTPGATVDGGVGFPEPTIFADLLPNKDIVGGQVDTGFVGIAGTPVSVVEGKEGVYEEATVAEGVSGLLLLSVDAYDAPRQINVVKGGNINTTVGWFRDKDDVAIEAVADALGGRYDSNDKQLRF